MKTWKGMVFVFLVALVAFGCSQKKQDAASLSPMGVEGEDKDMVTQVITTPEATEQAAPAVQTPAEPITMEAPAAIKTDAVPLTAEGTEKNIQIQTALKNAGLYFGALDGKIGPLTKKAIEEFQKMKGLKADGKVGPLTWAELQKYLTVQEPKR